MAITKINNVLVKHGKIMFGVITAIIIVAFVWFFTPGADGSILFGSDPNSPDAVCGDIAGTPVVNKDVTDWMKSVTLVQAAMTNRSPNETRVNDSIEQMFPAVAMYKTALKMGVVIPVKDVVKVIQSMPAFQKDGKFAADLYIKYENEKLKPAGYEAKDLENAVRMVLMVETLSAGYDSGVISPAEIQESLKNDLTSTEALAIVFSLEEFKKTIKPTEKELLDYYNSNKALFMSPEKFKGSAVVFSLSDYKVDESGAKAEYEKNKASLVNTDGKQMTFEQYKASYIQGQQVQLALKDARAFREEIYKATSNIAGDKVAYLKEYTDRASKQKKWMAINWFSKDDKTIPGVGAETALITAMVNRAKGTAPVTDPVIGEKAVYIAAVTDIQAPASMAFEIAKADVTDKYITAKASAKLKEAVSKFRTDMDAAKKDGKAIDKAKVESLVKGVAAVNANTIGLKEYVQMFLQMQDVKKLSAEQINNMKRFAWMNFRQSVDPAILSTPVGVLSKENSVPQGTILFFVTKRTYPTDKDLKEYAGVFDELYLGEKQQIVELSLNEWLLKNVKNNFQQPQTADQGKDPKEAPAQK